MTAKSKKSKAYYLSLPWDRNIVYSAETKKFTLYLKDNDLEYSEKTPEELIAIFPQELGAWIDEKLKNNGEIIEPLTLGNCNGRLNIKVSQSIHYKLLKEARMEGLTINHLLNNILNSYYQTFPKIKYVKKNYSPEETLAVVNCRSTIDKEIEPHQIYACGTIGIAYSFKPFKYFGVYAEKKVSKIYEVLAVIDIEKTDNINNTNCQIYWKNVSTADDLLIREAISRISKCAYRQSELKKFHNRVFLLDRVNNANTNFKKDSHGGLYGAKQYFNDIAKDCKDVNELAQKLNNKNWSDFETKHSTSKPKETK